MKLIYNDTNKIRFTDIPEKYACPREYKAKLSDIHSEVVIYVHGNYRNTRKYREKVVQVLNYITYCVIQNQTPNFDWVRSDPINTLPADIDFDDVEKGLGALFLTEDAIDWDVTPSDHFISIDEDNIPNKLPDRSQNTISGELDPKNTKVSDSHKQVDKLSAVSNAVSGSSSPLASIINKPLQAIKNAQKSEGKSQTKPSSVPTPKEDLYIQPPKYPRFDTSKVWLKEMSGSDTLVIYTTLPEVPTKQNEISVTTNLYSLTDRELMNLYPNRLIRTRSSKMYDKIEGLSYDEDLGVIIPIEGFTEEQVIDNIIQYPHLYKLKKYDQSGEPVNFYASIEIDGDLYPVDEIWDNLQDSVDMPRDSEFVKEYVVRRYLLEESVGVPHKFKLVGTLEPFLTLFMPPSGYVRRGYSDTLSIVKQCVKSRISYKQSRNPILRRLGKFNA